MRKPATPDALGDALEELWSMLEGHAHDANAWDSPLSSLPLPKRPISPKESQHWKASARRQLERRQLSELENALLKAMLAQQSLKLARVMERTARGCGGRLTIAPDEASTVRALQDRDCTNVLDLLKQSLGNISRQARLANRKASVEPLGSIVRMGARVNDDGHRVIEYDSTGALHVPWTEVEQLLWKLGNTRQVQANGCSYFENVEATSSQLSAKVTLSLPQNTETAIHLVGCIVLRRFVSDDLSVVVWNSLSSPVSSSQGLVEGVFLREHGWGTVRPSKDNPATACVLRSHSEISVASTPAAADTQVLDTAMCLQDFAAHCLKQHVEVTQKRVGRALGL